LGARPWLERPALGLEGSLSRNALVILSLSALPVSILAWAAGIATSSLQLTGFGLVSGLHPLWYVGTLTGVVGMLLAIATRRHSVLLTAYAIALALMLSSTGVLLERTPRFPYVFNSYVYGDGILRTAVIDYSEVYVSWPGWHLFSALAVGSSRLDPAVLLTWTPLGLLLVTLAALMTLFRRYRLPRFQRWIAIGIAITLFLGPGYPVPASLALVITIYVLALLLEAYLGRNGGYRSRIGLVLLLAALVPTHLLTSLVGVVVVGATSLLLVLLFKRQAGQAAVIGVVLLTGYLFYIAAQVTAQLLPDQIETMLNLERLFGSIAATTASAITSGSPEHLQVVRVRIGYVVALAALAAVGILVAVVRRTRLTRWGLPMAWFAGGTGALGVGGYGGEILARGSTLAAPGTIALASWLATIRIGRIVLAIAMITGTTFSPIFLYGNELFDYVRPAELAADSALDERHPALWSLERPSRTWYRDTPHVAGAPSVTVYGPLFDLTSAHIGTPEPPSMPFWSYDNGEVRIMVARPSVP
jgi:hypothetical protein